jgi:tetratricopeptide (TPR) repeat protein
VGIGAQGCIKRIFFILTLLMYVRYVEKNLFQKAKVFYGLALFFFALGLMSKPMLVTLPFVLLLLDWWPLKRFEFQIINSKRQIISRLILEKLPFLLLSAVSCVMTVFAQQKATKSLVILPFAGRLGNAVVSCGTYLVQMVFPKNLVAFYPYHLDLPVWQIAISCVFLFLITLLVLLTAKKFPYFFVGWFWYLGMLVPVIGLVQVGGQAHADRYTYLPEIGLCLAIVWAAWDLTTSWHYRFWLLGLTACGMIPILMACAWKQTAYWCDSESLWSHALACTSGNFVAHNNLGYALAAKGQTAEAIEHYQKALEINSDYAIADVNLGKIFLNEGRLDKAGEYFQQSVKINPDSAEVHNDLGILFAAQGRITEAAEHYQQAIQLNPDFAEVYNNLAILCASQGRFVEAVQCYQKALKIKPDYAEAHDNFGILLIRRGRVAEAMRQFQMALEIRGNSAEAHNDLGLLLVSLDQADEAIKHYQKAIELKSNYAQAHYNLGIVLANQGRNSEAIKYLKTALELANNQNNYTLADATRIRISFLENNSLIFQKP